MTAGLLALQIDVRHGGAGGSDRASLLTVALPQSQATRHVHLNLLHPTTPSPNSVQIMLYSQLP